MQVRTLITSTNDFIASFFGSRNKFGMTVLEVVDFMRNNFLESNIFCCQIHLLATVIPNLFRDLKMIQFQCDDPLTSLEESILNQRPSA